MTRLDDIKFACHVAAFKAIDDTLNEELDMNRKVWILDAHLPALIPALDRAIEAAMREVYDLMPESLNVSPAAAARVQADMVRSLKAIEAARATFK